MRTSSGLLVALLVCVGCGDEDGLSPNGDAAAIADANTLVDTSPVPDSGLGDADASAFDTGDAPDAAASDADPPDTAPRPEIVLLKQELKSIVETPGHPLSSLSVLAFDNGRVSYEGHFGHRYIDGSNATNNVAADDKTLYRVASMSKLVTTIGLLTLVDANKVDLDADASTYLGFALRNPNFPAKVITTRMLLSHLSSVRDDADYNFSATQSLESVMKPGGASYDAAAWATVDAASSRAPGDYFYYANLNFGLVASVIEGASGQRFDKFMQSKVFAPMGITAGFYPAEMPADVVARIATIYRKRDTNDAWDPQGPWYAQRDDFRASPPAPIEGLSSYVLGSNGTLFGPHGSLRISIADLGKIMQMLINNGKYGTVDVLTPASVAAMQANAWTWSEGANNGDNYYGLFRSWGLGTQRFTDTELGDRSLAAGGLKGFGHLGDAYGLLSGFIYDPETKDGLIYVIGGVGSDPLEYLGQYSAFYQWEESILTTLHRRAVARNTAP